MNFWDKWFNRAEALSDEPNIRFGRYSDSYKDVVSHRAWNQALQQFEAGDYFDSYRSFLTYLRDQQEDNVRWEEAEGSLRFELYQGSKRVAGTADADSLRAEARIAHVMDTRPVLMRRLCEQNYALRYARYAFDDTDNLVIVFDTETSDASPYKLYYALRELALQADKQDDLLLEEFQQLSPVDVGHLQELPENEKQTKCRFITRKIGEIVDYLSSSQIDEQQHPGGVAYLLLDLIYKLDYLVKPEGYTMEALERAHRLYFARENNLNTQQKNQRLLAALRELQVRAPEEYFREMYRGRSTFGITSPVTHDRLITLIDNELHHMDWYQEHQLERVAEAIPSYIVGYCLFNFAVPAPDRDLLHLYFRIVENNYFRQLGFEQDFCDEASGRLNRRAIRGAIHAVVDHHQAAYPRLRPALSNLRYNGLANFSRSYLLMLRDLDLTR